MLLQLLRVPRRIGDEGNSHLTSRFCGVVLGPTTISKINLLTIRDSYLLTQRKQ